MAQAAAVQYFRRRYGAKISQKGNPQVFDPESWYPDVEPGAYWLSQGCLGSECEVDEDGIVHPLDANDPHYAQHKERIGNEETYSISDIIRGAVHVTVLAGNPERPHDDNALHVWGERVWTLMEVVLSRSDSVTVQYSSASSRPTYEDIPKTLFPARAWYDSAKSRYLIENYTSLRLSRLELVQVALESLTSRKFKAAYRGDRVYALMGLLRIRPLFVRPTRHSRPWRDIPFRRTATASSSASSASSLRIPPRTGSV